MMDKGDESAVSRGILVLASGSRRRYQLLKQIGYTPDLVIPAAIDEKKLCGETPKQLVTRLSVSKAQKVFKSHPGSIILGADTVVAIGRRIIGKPKDLDQAASTLGMLSGRRHRVYSGVCVLGQGKRLQRSVVTSVKFKRLGRAEIDDYLDSGEWKGKAGSYAIQGRASAFNVSIIGSYTNVVGLPLHETYLLLSSLGIQPNSATCCSL